METIDECVSAVVKYKLEDVGDPGGSEGTPRISGDV